MDDLQSAVFTVAFTALSVFGLIVIGKRIFLEAPEEDPLLPWAYLSQVAIYAYLLWRFHLNKKMPV